MKKELTESELIKIIEKAGSKFCGFYVLANGKESKASFYCTCSKYGNEMMRRVGYLKDDPKELLCRRCGNVKWVTDYYKTLEGKKKRAAYMQEYVRRPKFRKKRREYEREYFKNNPRKAG